MFLIGYISLQTIFSESLMISFIEQPIFPPLDQADADGLLAFGGELGPEWLLSAYTRGIFPWYNKGDPILWWSPDPRLVLYPEELKVSKSMRNVLNQNRFTITYNRQFEAVIRSCSTIKRDGQNGTWITEDMIQAYLKMSDLGWAHSVEVWNIAGELVGGLYGIAIDGVFFGESMFSKESNASKVGFISWINFLDQKGVRLIDCQIYSEHLASLGAREITRQKFQSSLEHYIKELKKIELV